MILMEYDVYLFNKDGLTFLEKKRFLQCPRIGESVELYREERTTTYEVIDVVHTTNSIQIHVNN